MFLNRKKVALNRFFQYIICMDIVTFWKRVKTLIRQQKTTQILTAQACGLPLNTLRGWMSKGLIPPVDDAYSLAEYLGVSLEYLISGRVKERAEQIEKVRVLLAKSSEKLKRYAVKPGLT